MAKTILCHCEDVDVDEFFSAIEQGYADVETLKRYTGIGTGKCQGKCCLIQTMRLMAAAAPGPDTASPVPVKIPTIRQPVLPMRIEDIVDGRRDGE